MFGRAWMLVLFLGLSGCGGGGGGTTDDGTTQGTTDDGATSTGASATMGGTSTSTATGGGSTDPTTSASTTTGGGSTATGPTTGVDVSGFERFLMSTAAGPCGPGGDCDGFVELLASGMLRVEVFGGDETVVEVEISQADFTAAVEVFADPELLALLDGDEPLCNPPTDVFESMTVEIEGASHEGSTTGCGQPPVAAARTMATDLRTKYVP